MGYNAFGFLSRNMIILFFSELTEPASKNKEKLFQIAELYIHTSKLISYYW